eukprot:UN00411
MVEHVLLIVQSVVEIPGLISIVVDGRQVQSVNVQMGTPVTIVHSENEGTCKTDALFPDLCDCPFGFTGGMCEIEGNDDICVPNPCKGADCIVF